MRSNAFVVGVVGLTLVVAAVVVSQSPHAVSKSPDGIVDRPIENLEGAWVLNDVWTGYMGVAIQFEGNRFKYWFYSDVAVPDEPEFPLSGTWKWDGAVLELESDARLYDTRWHVYRYNGELCLLPDSARRRQLNDGKKHADRLLFRIDRFDARNPFLVRRGSVEVEEDETGTANSDAAPASAARPDTVPVTGVVLRKGKPLAGAIVAFHGRFTAIGITDDDGEYKLTTFKAHDGAIPGKYDVVIEADGLSHKYSDRRTSGLTATIEENRNPNRFKFLLDD